MLVVNLHLTDDEVGVFAEGFRNLFVSTDDEIDAWINKDVNIIGTCSLPEFLARRTFTIIFPGGQAEMDHIDNVALLLAVPATGIINIREITAKNFKYALIPTKPMQGGTRFLSECYACLTIPTTFSDRIISWRRLMKSKLPHYKDPSSSSSSSSSSYNPKQNKLALTLIRGFVQILSLNPGLFTLLTMYNKNKSWAHGEDIPRYPGVEYHTVDSFRGREAHIIVLVL